MDTISLEKNGWSLCLLAEMGAILSCRFAKKNILRPIAAPLEKKPHPADTASFILAPYSNRIRESTFYFAKKKYHLASPVSDGPHALHGTALMGDWQLLSATDTACELAFFNEASPAWPWAFSLGQKISIKEKKLSLSLSIENQSEETMPAGLGFHPYFADADQASLQFKSESVWLPDAENLPAEKVPVPPEWDFSSPKRPADQALDHCFTGWDGAARIRWDHLTFHVEIEATPDLSFAVVYVDRATNSFCFEPVSHMNDALNHQGRGAETGMHQLAPGGKLAGCNITCHRRGVNAQKK